MATVGQEIRQEHVVRVILADGDPGLHEDQIAFLTGLGQPEVVAVLDQLGERVAEVEPGVWRVVE